VRTVDAVDRAAKREADVAIDEDERRPAHVRARPEGLLCAREIPGIVGDRRAEHRANRVGHAKAHDGTQRRVALPTVEDLVRGRLSGCEDGLLGTRAARPELTRGYEGSGERLVDERSLLSRIRELLSELGFTSSQDDVGVPHERATREALEPGNSERARGASGVGDEQVCSNGIWREIADNVRERPRRIEKEPFPFALTGDAQRNVHP
jgi:hypothetical protein